MRANSKKTAGVAAQDANPAEVRERILATASGLFYARGVRAVGVDLVVAEAGVAKTSLYRHFRTKDDLALTAAAHWSERAEEFFAGAPYRGLADPLERLLGYVDFRIGILTGELADYTCFLGTLLQETYATHPDIRAACERGLTTHVDSLVGDIEAAKRLYAPGAPWSAQSLGVFIQTVLQGAFILAKAKQGPEVARDSLAHLRRYLESQFRAPNGAKPEETP